MTGPRRRASDDHNHPEYWTTELHNRFEDRLSHEVRGIREDVEAIGQRLTWLLGGLALLAVLFPLLVPFIERLLAGR